MQCPASVRFLVVGEDVLPPKAKRSLLKSCCGVSSRKMRASLVTDLFKMEVGVLRVATWTLPSLPWKVSIILAGGH